MLLIIRGHIRNSFKNKNLYNLIKDIYNLFPNLKIFIHTWNVVANNVSWRTITADNQKVDNDLIDAYFGDLSNLITHHIIDDDSNILLIGNLNGKVSSSLIPTIGWKNYWYGKYKIIEYIYNQKFNKDEIVVNMRFDLLENSNSFDHRNIVNFIKENGTNNININKNKFLFDYEKNGIDNIYMGSVNTMYKLARKFYYELDEILEENPNCQNPEKLVFRVNEKYV